VPGAGVEVVGASVMVCLRRQLAVSVPR
jgi:hypothetical protein